MSGEKVNENYREYLKSYTRHYNRNTEIYGGRKITERGGRKSCHSQRSQILLRRDGGTSKIKRSISKRKITAYIANILPLWEAADQKEM